MYACVGLKLQSSAVHSAMHVHPHFKDIGPQDTVSIQLFNALPSYDDIRGPWNLVTAAVSHLSRWRQWLSSGQQTHSAAFDLRRAPSDRMLIRQLMAALQSAMVARSHC